MDGQAATYGEDNIGLALAALFWALSRADPGDDPESRTGTIFQATFDRPI